MKVYCLFCKTNSEHIIAQNINKVANKFKAIAPTKVLQEKRLGKWEEKKQILLPGYVFLYGEDELDTSIRDKVFNVYKLLEYEAVGFV